MSTRQISDILTAFSQRFGQNNVLIGPNNSCAMMRIEGHHQAIDVFMQLIKNTRDEQVIALEFVIAAGDDLPIAHHEFLYSLHVVNYAAAHRHGMPNLVLSIRPGVDVDKDAGHLPPAIVALASRKLAGLKPTDIVSIVEMDLQQAAKLQRDIEELMDAIREGTPGAA